MKSVLILPPRREYRMRARWVKPRLPPSATTRARTWSASIRTASLAWSPTSASVSPGALTNVPIPPNHSRSADAARMAETSSGGLTTLAPSRPSRGPGLG